MQQRAAPNESKGAAVDSLTKAAAYNRIGYDNRSHVMSLLYYVGIGG